jgi:prolyl oligopeptidase
MSLQRGELLLLGLGIAGALLALLLPMPAARAAPRLAYPPAPRGQVVDEYGSAAVPDPYRWLEDLDSPETRAWIKAEAQLTASYLATMPQRARIRARIGALYDFEKTGVPFKEGGRYF